jgi:hypothetical protein
MTDDNLQDASPAEGAPALPVEAEQVATPTTTDEATEASPADDASTPAPKGVGKRIDELTRNWREAERREAALLEMLRARETPEVAPAAPAAPVKLPTLADFEYDEGKYQTALIDFTRAEARREAESVLKADRDRQSAEAAARTWQERAADFAKSKPDYEERVTDPSLPISKAMAKEIQTSEIGPQIAYHLAENRALAKEIAALPESAAARAIGRIEGALLAQQSVAKAPAPRPAVSQAPPPPPRIEAVEPEVSKDPDQMPVNEWLKWRNKQLSRKKA